MTNSTPNSTKWEYNVKCFIISNLLIAEKDSNNQFPLHLFAQEEHGAAAQLARL